MKKLLSIVLAVIMIFSLVAPAYAEESVTPVVIVSGMNAFPLTLCDTGEQIWPPKSESITAVIKENILPMIKFLGTGDWQYLGDELIEDVYKGVFGKVACDENGNSVYAVETKTFPLSVDNYPDIFENSDVDGGERGIAKSLIKAIGGENVYYFNYDWRLSPMKHADDLNAFIENVKKEKDADEVTLIPCSMGGTVTNAYLYKYGSDSIKKIVYTLSAIQGLSSVGEMFNRRLDINTDTLMSYLFSSQKDNLKMQLVMAAVNTAAEVAPCLGDFADRIIEESLDELNDRVYDELMLSSMGTFPGWWALVPDEYYDSAKESFFKGNISPEFEKLIDSYHCNVQRNAKELMISAQENGTEIYVIASYGFVGAPYTNQALTQTDRLIETHHQSGRAITAPYGEPFGEDYEPVGTVCDIREHNHVSADGIIDASVCFFPESTWFIKYNTHVGLPYGTDCEKFIVYLVTSEDSVTVHSNESFPQFMELDRLTGELSSLTGDKIKTDIKDTQSNFIVRFVIIADTLIRTVKSMIIQED